MKSIALVLCFCLTSITYSQVNIIPQPVEVNPGKGVHMLKNPVQIVYDEASKKSAEFLSDYLKRFYKVKSKLTPSTGKSRDAYYIILMTGASEKKGWYELKIDKYLSISGDEEGVFFGVQTLIQMLPPLVSNNPIQLPYVTIRDYPRFGYRGLHLDCGRNFMPIDFIKKYIDYIALHKMNYFHWHLTEDQGWRIEIKKYPRLTEVGAWRNGTIIGRHPGMGNDNKRSGGFYTQEQIKEIVKYAADRYITVVPEIEMPGHSSAAIAAYPNLSCFPDEPTKNYFPKNAKWAGDTTGKQVQQAWGVYSDVFCAGKEETFKFLQDVIDEVVALFPGKYIHVGGDECPKANWKRCPLCQQRIKENTLKDEHALQSYFIQRMEKYINSKGKTLIGWDEILEGGLAPNAIVMSWRGEQGGIQAAKEKHNVIMTPTTYVYLDYSQTENEDSIVIGGYLPVEKVYSYDPIPAALSADEGRYVLGAQANVWTEYMTNPKKVEYMLFPRLSALSEAFWSPKEKKNWDDFEKRLQVQFKRYDLWKANYSKAYYDLKATVIPSPDSNGISWKLESKLKDGYIGYIPTARNSAIIKYKEPIKITKDTYIQACYFVTGRKLSSVEQQFHINKATGKKITLTTQPSPTYKADGAFTLVNGVQNEMGLAKSKQFLGFNGTDCEALIDLGKEEKISNVVVHSLRANDSWIWRPLTVEVFISNNGTDFTSAGLTDDFIVKQKSLETGTMKVEFSSKNSRYVKVLVKNWGDIPEGSAGAGNKAWLFVDEIEVN